MKLVNQLSGKARRASDSQDYGRAYELTLDAWEAAKSYPQDERLKQTAERLNAELDELGRKANSRYTTRAADPSTPLIEK